MTEPSLRERIAELLAKHRVRLPELPQRLNPRVTSDERREAKRSHRRLAERLQ